MNKIFLILLLVVSSFSLKAQYPGFAPVANLEKFKTDFTTAAQKTLSIKSDFVQEKNMSMLSEKITSKGKFWFKKENKVRMEYIQPYQYLMIMNKDKVFVKDGKKENKMSARSNKLFQQINKIMIDCMQGTAFNNPDFKTKIFENKSASLIQLTPVTKGLKGIFKTINVVVDNKDFSVISINLMEQSGDNTVMRFTNKVLNATIPDELFAIK